MLEVCTLMLGSQLKHMAMAARNVRFFHLQSVLPPANKIVQLISSILFIGVVLALLCFVLFNDCVQPCFKPKTIKPSSIIDLDLLFACNLHKVIKGLHRLPETFNPKPLKASIS